MKMQDYPTIETWQREKLEYTSKFSNLNQQAQTHHKLLQNTPKYLHVDACNYMDSNTLAQHLLVFHTSQPNSNKVITQP